MAILDILKKTCIDGSQIWVWETCSQPAPIPEPTPDPLPGPDTPEEDPSPIPPLSPIPGQDTPTGVAKFIGFNIGAEEVCGVFNGSRPSIAVTSNGTPCIVIDKGTDDVIQSFNKVNGSWKERELAHGSKGGKYDASRLYMPHVEIDESDRVWVSCKFGCAEYGKMLGQGLWLINDLNTFEPSKFSWITASETHKGNGNVAIDRGRIDMARMLATTGKWLLLNSNMDRIQHGTLPIGESGEKLRGLISPRFNLTGIIHLVSGGYSRQSSSYINDTMTKSIVWANYAQYPEQGNDMAHPGIGIDVTNPNICYISAPYKGVSINVWNNGALMYSPAALKIIDSKGSMGGPDRFGPQWAPNISGGAFLTWVNNKRIKIVKVSKKGKVGAIMDICAGVSPSMCMGKDGTIHLAYVNGGMRYRKLTLKQA